MSYVTFDDYSKYSGSDNADLFYKNLAKASAILDSITNSFYYLHDLETDKITFRKEKFKQALCAQIQFFEQSGTNTALGLANKPQTISMGRTSVSLGNKGSTTNNTTDTQTSLIADDVYFYLQGTGLLYRGVSS